MRKFISTVSIRDAREDEGFTLIELLVVVLIIGILAAIAIPVFLNQQNQAHDASAMSDLQAARVAEMSYAAANNGALTSDTSQLVQYGWVKSADDGLAGYGISTDGTVFCVSAKSASGTWFATTSTDPVGPGYCGANDVMRHYQPAFPT